MKHALAVFDMDGTILYTLEDLTDSINRVLSRYGYPTHSLEQVRGFVGNGLHKLVSRALPAEAAPELIQAVYADFLVYYQAHCADKTRPYPGVADMLRQLRSRGWRTAIVSNKSDAGVQKLCQRHFPGLFDAAVGQRPGIEVKPAPDGVNAVLEQLHIPAAQAVYVGDSEVDLATARRSGLDCICVSWGFRSEEQLRQGGAGVIAHSPEQLTELLLAAEAAPVA